MYYSDSTLIERNVFMQILKQVTKEGKVVGVELDMDGYICPFPTKGLYNEQILVGLIDSGYKFFDYHGDIEMPNGQDLTSLDSVDLSTYNKEDIAGFEGMLMTAEMEALTDTEASKYYSYRSTMQKIELPREESYEINTREEFEQYIAKQQIMIASIGYSSDNRPINSFVHPDALYSMEELVQDKNGNIYSKLNILAHRRRFKDYQSYQKVVKFLKDKGVLNVDNPTAGQFLDAYYTWGPDGIKGDLINRKFKQGIDGEFRTPDDNLPSSGDKMNHIAANRTKVPFILNTDAELRHLDSVVSLNGILQVDEFGRDRLAITRDNLFIEAKRRDNKGYKYSLGYAQKSIVTDRLYFTYIVNGFKYIYKASVQGCALFIASSTSAVWSSLIGYSIASNFGNVNIPLDEVSTIDNYLLWNVCINEAASYVKDRTVNPPVKSSYDLLMDVGMTPISAVRYIACHVLENNMYNSNSQIKDMYDGLSLECVDKFYQPVPDYIYDAFMLNEEDVVSVRDFIDMADVDGLIDRRDKMILGELVPGMPGYDKTFITDKKQRELQTNNTDALQYYNNMKFVIDCIDGAVSIDAFGDGLLKDEGSGTKISADIFMSIIYAELGMKPDLSAAIKLLRTLNETRTLDTSKLFRTRDHAYNGFLIDYSRARKCKAHAVNTWAWAYISKVYRELGNKPIDKFRPYLLELIILQNDNKGMKFRNGIISCIKDAIDKADIFPKESIITDTKDPDYGITYYDMATNMLDDVASKLFFKILGKKGYTVDGTDYVYNIKFDLEHFIDVRIPEPVVKLCQSIVKDRESHVRYITVFDACEREFSHYARGGGSFSLHIVNADITPWSISPRKGFKVNTYSLLPSYYKRSALVDKFGEAWYNTAASSGAISQIPLSEMLPRLELPSFSFDEQHIMNQDLKAMKEYTDFDSCLLFGLQEQVSYYVKRWSLACKMASERGMIVEHMPMKQDIAYQYLSEILTGEEIQDEIRYMRGVNMALGGTEMHTIKYGTTDLLSLETHTGQLSITQVKPGDIPTELFADIYLTLIYKNKVVMLSGNWILGFGENVCIPLTTIDNPVIQKVINEYAVKYNDSYYIVSVKGIYKIGV